MDSVKIDVPQYWIRLWKLLENKRMLMIMLIDFVQVDNV